MKSTRSTRSTRLINTLICALCLSTPLREAFAAQYSKFELVLAAKQVGKWDAIKAWIDAAGLSDEWLAVEYLVDSEPQFATITNAVVAAGIATAGEVAAILDAARDTAPDALLAYVYAREIKTEAGRVRWHGKRTYFREDTNTLMAVSTYADGWQYSLPFTVAKPRSLEARLAAAKAEKAKRRTATMPPGLAAVEAARDDSAATTNEVSVVIGPDIRP